MSHASDSSFFFRFKKTHPPAFPFNSSHPLHWNAVLQQFLYDKGLALKDLKKKSCFEYCNCVPQFFFGIVRGIQLHLPIYLYNPTKPEGSFVCLDK